jgi:hypothetical protein
VTARTVAGLGEVTAPDLPPSLTGPGQARQHKEGTPIMTTAPVQGKRDALPAPARQDTGTGDRPAYYCQNPGHAAQSHYPGTCCGMPMVTR